ncbi:hypothetical protein QFC19_008346 [Naganishia cerealis]|uniref:Uncharacterized protein n=1 Tax=Naganishia cerealis TaxID=610337 RepID=A0ACC2V2M1_9TREE|nr:hypothetical protein QFC19_008346 [Naganishia cerealis]
MDVKLAVRVVSAAATAAAAWSIADVGENVEEGVERGEGGASGDASDEPIGWRRSRLRSGISGSGGMYAGDGVMWPVIWMVANVIIGEETSLLLVRVVAGSASAGAEEWEACDSEIVASGDRKRGVIGVAVPPLPPASSSPSSSLVRSES